MIRKSLAYILIGILLFLGGCEKWYTTEDISHISQLPEFEIIGGDFLSLLREDSTEFEDPGVTASADGETLQVYSSGTVDLTEVGVYIIRYYAQNKDGIKNTADRIIAVTNNDVSGNDLSGKYSGTLWAQVVTKVKKVDENGLYESDDILGYPGLPVPGKFVDLGNNELILVNGEGAFGRYAASEGSYSRSTLSWTVALLDDPYEGVELQVLWRKSE